MLCSAAGEVTACLAESNSSLPPGGWLVLRLHDTTGCQTGLTTGWIGCLFTRYSRLLNRLTTVLNEQLFVQPVVKPGCTTGLTTGCIHDTAGCLCTRYNRIDNWFDNRIDNRLYRVYKHLPGCQTGCIV